jgi:hypothetical protein
MLAYFYVIIFSDPGLATKPQTREEESQVLVALLFSPGSIFGFIFHNSIRSHHRVMAVR